MGVFGKLNVLIKRHPFKMNMFLYGTAFGCGDVAVQYVFPFKGEEGRFVLDEERTKRACLYGSLLFGPLTVLWHMRAKPLIKNPFVTGFHRQNWAEAKKDLHDSMFRIFVDQLTFPSLVWIPLYNASMCFMKYDSDYGMHIKQKLEANWWYVLTSFWKMWIPINLMSLILIPLKLHSVVTCLCTIGWSGFLSYTFNNRGKELSRRKSIDEIENKIGEYIDKDEILSLFDIHRGH